MVPRTLPVDLEIDWKEEKYAYLRDQLYAGSGDEWTLVTGDVDGPTIRATVSAPPGQTLVSLHPAYRRAELEPFLASAVARGARRKSAGTSADSHEIEVLEFGDEGADRERLLVFTRFHPYETAGSYCAEGMVGFPIAGRPRRRWSARSLPGHAGTDVQRRWGRTRHVQASIGGRTRRREGPGHR